MRSKFESMIREAQISITEAIEKIDGKATFQEDCWTRANGGGVPIVETRGDVPFWLQGSTSSQTKARPRVMNNMQNIFICIYITD